MKKNIVKTVLLAVLLTLSGWSFGQVNEIGTNKSSDHLTITFGDMGNLPIFGTMLIGWHAPFGWISQTGIYTGPNYIYMAYAPIPYVIWIEGYVKVELPVPGSTNNAKYSATKWWSGFTRHVTFNQSDFVRIESTGTTLPDY
jgi:hypothetical protein